MNPGSFGFRAFVLARACALVVGLLISSPARADSDSLQTIFDRAWESARATIFDTTLVQARLTPENHARLRARVSELRTLDDLAALLNTFFDAFCLSHTGFFTPRDLEYSVLGTAGSRRTERLPLFHIGAQYRKTERGYVVRSVLDGYPAARAGLRRGDVMVAAGGKPFHPVDSFAAGGRVKLRVQRGARALRITVEPVYESMHESFRHAVTRSVRRIDVDGRRVGIVHLWVLTSLSVRDDFAAVVLDSLSDCQGIILDLRDGFGGYWIEFNDLFFASREGYAQITAFGRSSVSPQHTNIPPARPHRFYAGPLVTVINEGTRSGKEAITFQLEKSHRGPVVGSATAGAFIGAAISFADPRVPFLMELPATYLWLDGRALEGVGVAPDSAVSYPLDGDDAGDPQMEAGVAAMRALLRTGR